MKRKFKFTEIQGENGRLWGGLCPTALPAPRQGSAPETDLEWGTWGMWKSRRIPHHRSWRAAGNKWPSPFRMVGVTPGPAHGSQYCVAMLPGSSGCSATGHLCSPSTKMQSEKVSSSVSCLLPVLHQSKLHLQFKSTSKPAKALTRATASHDCISTVTHQATISLWSLWLSTACSTVPAPYLLCDSEQHSPKANVMNSILRGKVRPPYKGLEVRSQPDTHRPATSTTGCLRDKSQGHQGHTRGTFWSLTSRCLT